MFALIYFVFGLLLCFFSASILVTATRIIGGLLALYGAFQLYLYFGRRKTINGTYLFAGVPCLLFGLVFVFSPESLISIFPVIGGVVLIINSIMQMQRSFVLKDHGFENWFWTFVLSILLLIAGIVVLLKPVQAMAFILQLVGAGLIVESVVILYNQYELNKVMKH
jgi:uncharacterized membrane protein HdeD (DUF308 family)